ncbi:MAG: hypothetical protein AAF446_04405 [Pseudomonadota bacterium]
MRFIVSYPFALPPLASRQGYDCRGLGQKQTRRVSVSRLLSFGVYRRERHFVYQVRASNMLREAVVFICLSMVLIGLQHKPERPTIDVLPISM